MTGPTEGASQACSKREGTMIDLTTLRRIPLFRDFTDEQLSQVLATVADRRFAKHQFVVREGEPGDTFFVIAAGSVAVCRVGPDGRETILSILKEGDFFGEMSMFDSSLRSASIKTLTDVEVGAVRQADFLALIDRSPQIGKLLVIELSERLRAANALIAATTSQDIRARLAALLLNLAEQFGEAVDNGTRITLRLTNQEMANMIGTTRETVNLTLNRFWDDRLVDMRTAHALRCAPACSRGASPARAKRVSRMLGDGWRSPPGIPAPPCARRSCAPRARLRRRSTACCSTKTTARCCAARPHPASASRTSPAPGSRRTMKVRSSRARSPPGTACRLRTARLARCIPPTARRSRCRCCSTPIARSFWRWPRSTSSNRPRSSGSSRSPAMPRRRTRSRSSASTTGTAPNTTGSPAC